MTSFFIENGDVILRLVLAITLGMLIGLERLIVHKEAGMKTHALVALGAALFIVISDSLSKMYGDFGWVDPSRMASQIIVGIGFLGAGSIILQGSRLTGLTTASGLWVTAGIGMAAGFGLFSLAMISTFFVLLIFISLYIIEKPIRRIINTGEFDNKNEIRRD